jgi:hypothetical protein
LDFIGGADEAKGERAGEIVAALGSRASDLGGGSWRVFEFDTPTQEMAVTALEKLLNEIDPDWRDVLAVVTE